ncbi:hypothetical protein PCA31118_04134 [Pandoraea captiosa]|uniref:Uncharacterized protein n=1 Tax=Pandoraea captiosa TaxID=2508302 RepID=A0A5E5AGQ7_9BURK|nr:hypothetical protein [Pandoraea captiosa]VVE72257.1 hypothetical protein PCA31118_04134 [Pandoraea captiosa]
MAITIGSPEAAAHRAWRLPGQGSAATIGTHRAQSAADRYSNALRSLSSTPQTPAVTQDDAVKLSQSATAPRET